MQSDKKISLIISAFLIILFITIVGMCSSGNEKSAAITLNNQTNDTWQSVPVAINSTTNSTVTLVNVASTLPQPEEQTSLKTETISPAVAASRNRQRLLLEDIQKKLSEFTFISESSPNYRITEAMVIDS